jgi:acyl dehydratase
VTATVLKSWPAHDYLVGADAIGRYSATVGETDPVHFDRGAARAAGFRDVVAPPMFAVVYTAQPMKQAFHDPWLGLDFGRLLHIGQEFAWDGVVVAGDLITVKLSLVEDRRRDGHRFCSFASFARNQDELVVMQGKCQTIIRGS